VREVGINDNGTGGFVRSHRRVSKASDRQKDRDLQYLFAVKVVEEERFSIWKIGSIVRRHSSTKGLTDPVRVRIVEGQLFLTSPELIMKKIPG
jgi:hypothetical protein